MARTLFFTPRGFRARTELLEAAIRHNRSLCRYCIEFISAAIKKAGKLSSFRNQLAHGEQTFDVRLGSPTFKQIILISGKAPPDVAATNAVTIEQLNVATANYRELARLLMDVTEFVHDKRDPNVPVQCLKKLGELPNQAAARPPTRASSPETSQ